MDSVMMEGGESVLASTEPREELSIGNRTINPALVFGVGGKDPGRSGEGFGDEESSEEEMEDEDEDDKKEEDEDDTISESRVKEEELEEKHGTVYAVREAPRLKALSASARRQFAQARVQVSSGSRGSSVAGNRSTRSCSRRGESEGKEEEGQGSRARYASSINDVAVVLPLKPSPTRKNSGAVERARSKAVVGDAGIVTRSSSRASSASGTSASSIGTGEAKNIGTVVIKTTASTSQSTSTSTCASEEPEAHHPTKVFAEPKPTHSRSKKLVAVYIPPKPQNIVFPYSSLQSGYVFDRRMRFHTELPLAKLDDDFHPEDPRRILEIYDELMAAGLVWDPEGGEMPSVEQMWHITARKATRDEICLVHSETHYEWCRTLRGRFFCFFFENSFSVVGSNSALIP